MIVFTKILHLRNYQWVNETNLFKVFCPIHSSTYSVLCTPLDERNCKTIEICENDSPLDKSLENWISNLFVCLWKLMCAEKSFQFFQQFYSNFERPHSTVQSGDRCQCTELCFVLSLALSQSQTKWVKLTLSQTKVANQNIKLEFPNSR